jgi:flagellar hook protein FlgE
MVSDNLANASTTGYKTTTGMFDDLVTGSSSASQYSSGGVTISGRQNITQQGLLQATTNPTDVGIQGQGFFIVSSAPSGGQTSYTRNGAFTIDNQGYLDNQGSYLMGYRTDASGNTIGSGQLVPIDTTVAEVSAAPTTKTTFQANLPADAAAGATFTTSMPVYDALGAASTIQVTWTKSSSGSNSWTGSFAGSATDASGNPTGTVTGGPITVTFNPDGSLASTSPASPSVKVTGWKDGAADSSIAVNLGTAGGTDGLTQYSSGAATPSISITGINSDGLAYGKLSSVSVGQNGMVNATYSNGQTIPIYKIPIATFDAPDQLSAQSDGLYQATVASGNPTVQASGTNGAGTVFGSELESSATNTNDQFSTMMTAQQAYSASAQVVTTVNKMFDTLLSAMR